MAKKALVLLAEGFEEIEAVTVIDILRRAGIDVTACGLVGKEVIGAHGLKVVPDSTLDGFNQEIDAIVLPGGMPGAENLAKSDAVKRLIKKMDAEKKLIAAICASPALVLAPAGVLDEKRATCYPGMEENFSRKTNFSEDKVVVDGNIITSRAPATALIFSLAIAERLAGKKVSERLKKNILA